MMKRQFHPPAYAGGPPADERTAKPRARGRRRPAPTGAPDAPFDAIEAVAPRADPAAGVAGFLEPDDAAGRDEPLLQPERGA